MPNVADTGCWIQWKLLSDQQIQWNLEGGMGKLKPNDEYNCCQEVMANYRNISYRKLCKTLHWGPKVPAHTMEPHWPEKGERLDRSLARKTMDKAEWDSLSHPEMRPHLRSSQSSVIFLLVCSFYFSLPEQVKEGMKQHGSSSWIYLSMCRVSSSFSWKQFLFCRA